MPFDSAFLRQNHEGGAEGPRMMWCFDGHSLPGGKLISLLALAPNPHTGLYEVITGPLVHYRRQSRRSL